MAEKKAMVTYDSVMRELKAGKYRPVYLLMGDESYFIDIGFCRGGSLQDSRNA